MYGFQKKSTKIIDELKFIVKDELKELIFEAVKNGNQIGVSKINDAHRLDENALLAP